MSEFPVEINCRGCGEEIRLWFNGGELDYKTCCGFDYELRHGRIDFVVTGPADD